MRPLYLFPHLPKTGGAAVLQNAERFFPRSKCLRLNHTHRQYYYHPTTEELCFYERDDDWEKLIGSLTLEEKTNVEFASGHDLPYGFHRHFPQEARYFLFIREPIARTISLYNYQRYQRDVLDRMKRWDESHRRLALFSDRWFLIDGKVPSFEEWLDQSYDRDYPFYFTMTRSLQQLGYLEGNSIDRMFEKFFFVGITNTMNEDELFLYDRIGIGSFWANRNASHPYVLYKNLERRIQEKIHEKNGPDFELYKKGLQINREFKEKKSDWPQIVKRMEWAKKRAYVKEAIFPLIKRCLRPIWTRIRVSI